MWESVRVMIMVYGLFGEYRNTRVLGFEDVGVYECGLFGVCLFRVTLYIFSYGFLGDISGGSFILRNTAFLVVACRGTDFRK